MNIQATQIIKMIVVILVVTAVVGMSGLIRVGNFSTLYEATEEEIALNKIPNKVSYDRNFQWPSDEKVKKQLEEVLRIAEEEESRIRYMLTQGMVPTNHYKGMCYGSVIVRSQNTRYFFIFNPKTIFIQQVNKIVFEDKVWGKERRSEGCRFFFNGEIDKVSSFGYGAELNGGGLSFYTNGRIASATLIIESNRYYWAKWDEAGKVVEETIRIIEK